MTPEEKVASALDEFHELVVEGCSIEQAATMAAERNSLRTEVVLKRAKDRYGDLEGIAGRAETVRRFNERAARIRQSALDYNSIYHGPDEPPADFVDVVDWVESSLSLELSPDEASSVVGIMNVGFDRQIRRDLNAMLKKSSD